MFAYGSRGWHFSHFIHSYVILLAQAEMTQQDVQLALINEEKSLSHDQQQEIRIPIASQADSEPTPVAGNKKPRPDLLIGNRKEYIEIAIPLYVASLRGDWEAANEILIKRPELVRFSITGNNETALHVAASAKSSKQVEEFVENLMTRMTNEDLELENNSSEKLGNTALCLAAAAGNLQIVKIMIKKNRKLVAISGSQEMPPLYMAVLFGHYEVAKYLYNNFHKLDDDCWDIKNRPWLLAKCVESDMFDIALDIVKKYELKLGAYGNALTALARKADVFAETESNIIMRTIDPVWTCIRPKVGPSKKESKANALELLKIIWRKIAEMRTDQIDGILRGPPDFPIKQDEKPAFDKEDQTLLLLKQISENTANCKEPMNLAPDSENTAKEPTNQASQANARPKFSSRILFIAAEMGNTSFVIELIRLYPDIIWKLDDDNRSIFHTAVKHRHEGIYNLLYEIGSMKDLITPLKDTNDNNMLHLVGKSAKKKRLEDVSGVAFQMQRELLWFKEVEDMIPPSYRERKNKDDS
ncbi:hypothetical protein L1887_08147 [Cichorium endivia]|nr:hypothetical protein L1887_08147 [Cichorium endivia]